MKITFGVCTYNRKEILMRSAKSLCAISGIEKANIRIYDDHSSELDRDLLLSYFPNAKSIVIRSQNVGADMNTSLMFDDFLKTGDDYLVIADADLIYRTDCLKIIEELIPETDGFFSLFNTPAHPTKKAISTTLVEKDYVGAAGCCIHRSLVYKIKQQVGDRKSFFDWRFCDCLRNNGIRILTAKDSIVQHIGGAGQNSKYVYFDYGMGFRCDSLENAQCIEDLFEEHMSKIYQIGDSLKLLQEQAKEKNDDLRPVY